MCYFRPPKFVRALGCGYWSRSRPRAPPPDARPRGSGLCAPAAARTGRPRGGAGITWHPEEFAPSHRLCRRTVLPLSVCAWQAARCGSAQRMQERSTPVRSGGTGRRCSVRRVLQPLRRLPHLTSRFTNVTLSRAVLSTGRDTEPDLLSLGASAEQTGRGAGLSGRGACRGQRSSPGGREQP